jgi:hypothetical protein
MCSVNPLTWSNFEHKCDKNKIYEFSSYFTADKAILHSRGYGLKLSTELTVVYGKDSTEHTNKICRENIESIYATDDGQYAYHFKWLNTCSF